MKLKPDLKLRKIGRRYMIVDTCTKQVDMTDVYTMNETAARLWQQAGVGEVDARGLAEWLCGEYDVDMDTALRDVERLLGEWQRFGLIL